MVLIPRNPINQNVLCKHDALSGTAEAGAIVYLSASNLVAKVVASGNVPFGMLGTRVKANAAGLPQNFEFPGEIGTNFARLGDPVLVYHGGLFETTHYDLPAGCAFGAPLYAELGEGKLTAVTSGVALDFGGAPKIVAVAQLALSAGDAAAFKHLPIKLLGLE